MKASARLAFAVACLSAWGCSSTPSASEGNQSASPSSSETPYIDSLRKKLDEESANQAPSTGSATPYLDAKRKELEEKDRKEGKTPSPESGSNSPYIDRLKRENPSLSEPSHVMDYIPMMKDRLGPAPEGGAIAAVNEGRSELHPRFQGDIKAAFGMRYVVTTNRTITGDSAAVAQSFNSIYGSSYAPELAIFYDRELLRLDGGGSIGLVGSLGLGYFHGYGNFQFTLQKPDGSGTFSSQSQTMFQFFEMPAMLGVSARLSLLKYLQPYALVGPAVIGYVESRNDQVAGYRGFSEGIQATGGVAILLDWISSSARWEAYSANSVQHTYLTVEYTLLQPLAGEVSVSTSGLSAGITFEY